MAFIVFIVGRFNMYKKVLLFFILLLIPIFTYASSISMSCNDDVVSNGNITCNISGNSSNIVTAISIMVKVGNNISFAKFEPSSIWQGDGDEGDIELYTAMDILGNFDIGKLVLNVDSIDSGYDTNIILDSISYFDDRGKETKINNYTKKIRIASTNNDLSSLDISPGPLSPTFNSKITNYSTTLNSKTVKITATTADRNAKLSGDIGTRNLNIGNNTFKINVVSESGSSKTYVININRLSNDNNNSSNTNTNTNTNDNKEVNNNNVNYNKSNNSNLKNIILTNNNFNFIKDITEYDINVLYDIDNLDIEAIPEDDKAKVEITGNKNLKVGLNKISILVTAEDGTTKEYIINVTRKEDGYKLSNNNNIRNIVIDNYNIKFNKKITDYKLRIKNEKKLDIKVFLEDDKSTYKVIGNSDLKNNSIIKIVITAEDNSTKIYKINIVKNDTTIKIIFISIITILIIINILRIILRRKRDGKDKEDI